MKIGLSGDSAFNTSQDEYPSRTYISFILAVLQRRVTIHSETGALKYF